MSELSIITGGEPLEVEFLDGKSDTVTVRTLSLATIANELAVADGDEVAMVEIFTGTRDKPGEQRLRALRIREAKLAEQVGELRARGIRGARESAQCSPLED
jgi:hypothetical protein